MKRIFYPLCMAVILFLALLMLAPASAAASVSKDAEEILLSVNGHAVIFDDCPPVIVDGRMLIPAQYAFEKLGYDVMYDDTINTLTLTSYAHTIVIAADSPTFTVNERIYDLDVPARIINGHMMIPLRSVFESIEYSVEWSEAVPIAFVRDPLFVEWRAYSIGGDDNGRFMAKSGDWIYYADTLTRKIYKSRADGSDKMKLCDDLIGGTWGGAGFINVVNDWVYYRNASDGGKLYKVRTDGTGRVKITDDSAAYINVAGNKAYYCNIINTGGDYVSSLYSVDTDGLNKAKLHGGEGRYEDMRIVGDWLYFSYSDSIYEPLWIWKVRTDGTGLTRLDESSGRYLNIVDDHIYFADTYLFKARADGTGMVALEEEGWVCGVNVADDWIYYTCTSPRERMCGIYKIRADGSENTKLSDAYSENIYIFDDWIYFFNEHDNYLLYRFRTDGTEPQRIGGDGMEVSGDYGNLPEYTITFSGGVGATGTPPAPIKFKAGEVVVLPEPSDLKKGDAFFDGWIAKGTTAEFSDKAMFSSDVTLVARWMFLDGAL